MAATAHSRERGATLVESVFVLLLFVSLIVGIVDVSRLAYAFACVSDTARDAARWASVRGAASAAPADGQAVADYVRTNLVGLDAGAVRVTTTWSPSRNSGSNVEVAVDYRWKSVFDALVPATVDLHATSTLAVMR
jgi:Flp pilus assembly protein TadG